MDKITRLIKFIGDINFSDIHIRENENIYIRENGFIEESDEFVDKVEIEKFLNCIGKKELFKRVYSDKEIDFSFEQEERRFRGNIFLQNGKIGMVFRNIKSEILNLKSLGIPKVVERFTELNSGIIIITGPTGSGKTTTLAALVEHINMNHKKHIITIEDPIEYIYSNKLSIITQREIDRDSKNFNDALKFSLRQDPDVLVIGELRDEESVKIAMRAAETGHLCFCTLHTLGASNAIERIIDMFDSSESCKVRIQLSYVLKGVLSQQLIHTNKEVFVVVDILNVDKSVSNMIREGKCNQIDNYVLTNKSKGMVSMDEQIISLFKSKKIDINTLQGSCIDKESVMRKVGIRKDVSKVWEV
ncbi:type IV pilus twitching motility protein PilT [Peptostreptococcus faecalis]|uniref:type IV pilus twitching motility protein PilT n=1 Tax=Peptostreptococcus faecalis TaxID=2045015 RepID=UPI000C7D6AF8|nr:PilT/PilU family type 4a pilus ATPase [Peptostreptococcus faecalis]